CFKLEQHDIGEAVIDFNKVEVFQINGRHLQRFGSGEAQANDKRIWSRGDVISRVGMTFSDPAGSTGGGFRGRGQSGEVMTPAAAPSVSKQQSNSRKGFATQRALR